MTVVLEERRQAYCSWVDMALAVALVTNNFGLGGEERCRAGFGGKTGQAFTCRWHTHHG